MFTKQIKTWKNHIGKLEISHILLFNMKYMQKFLKPVLVSHKMQFCNSFTFPRTFCVLKRFPSFLPRNKYPSLILHIIDIFIYIAMCSILLFKKTFHFFFFVFKASSKQYHAVWLSGTWICFLNILSGRACPWCLRL